MWKKRICNEGARGLLVLMAILVFALPAAAENTPKDWAAEALAAFDEANTLLHTDPLAAREKHLQAAAAFERILGEGQAQNGELYFNLGNAYYLAGDLGRAILSYRRAEIFLPGDLEIRTNLTEARRQRRDTIASTANPPLFKTLLFFHYDFSIPARAGFFLFAYLLIWTFAAAFLRWPRVELRWAAGICAACALLAAGSVFAESLLTDHGSEGVILAQQVTVRQGDSAMQSPAFAVPLHAGTEFTLIQTRGDWYQIELADERAGWVPADAASLLELP